MYALHLKCVCMYVYVCVFVMYVCIYVCIRLLGRIGFDGPEDYIEFLRFAEEEAKNKVLTVIICMYVCLYVCMYVYSYIHLQTNHSEQSLYSHRFHTKSLCQS